MRIAILGAGSLGSVIGGRLAQAGHAVTLINRSEAYVEAVTRNGLMLEEAGQREVVRLMARRSPEGLDPVDLVIVLVKSFDTEAAMRDAHALVGPETTVMSLQNGLGQEKILARLVGSKAVIAGKTYVGGVMLAPGVVSAGTAGKTTVIGALSGTLSPRVRAIAEAFGQAGLICDASTNIRGAMWDKLLVNVATGALAGITGLNYGNLYDLPEIRDIAIEAVAEAMKVACALGITLETTHPRVAWEKARSGLPFDFKTSILQSLERRVRTEIDYINGAVVQAGKQHFIPTPVNATLVACVKGLERAFAPKLEATA